MAAACFRPATRALPRSTRSRTLLRALWGGAHRGSGRLRVSAIDSPRGGASTRRGRGPLSPRGGPRRVAVGAHRAASLSRRPTDLSGSACSPCVRRVRGACVAVSTTCDCRACNRNVHHSARLPRRVRRPRKVPHAQHQVHRRRPRVGVCIDVV